MITRIRYITSWRYCFCTIDVISLYNADNWVERQTGRDAFTQKPESKWCRKMMGCDKCAEDKWHQRRKKRAFLRCQIAANKYFQLQRIGSMRVQRQRLLFQLSRVDKLIATLALQFKSYLGMVWSSCKVRCSKLTKIGVVFLSIHNWLQYWY